MVQIQPTIDVVWGISPTQGVVFEYQPDHVPLEYSTFGNPLKTMWSTYHNELIVLCKHGALRYNQLTNHWQTFYGTNTHELMDLDISMDGQVLVAMQSLSTGNIEIIVLGNDLFSIVGRFNFEAPKATKYNFQKTIFMGQGKILGVIEQISTTIAESSLLSSSSSSSNSVQGMQSSASSSSSSSYSGEVGKINKFFTIDLTTTQISTVNFEINGNLIALVYEKMYQISIGATTAGQVIVVDNNGVPALIGNLKKPISSAALVGYCNMVNSVEQMQVRVYVGSQSGWNDRWDSGILTTNKQSILYGGGDNLEPGQTYWVHIAVNYGGGWSLPQIKSFVVPK